MKAQYQDFSTPLVVIYTEWPCSYVKINLCNISQQVRQMNKAHMPNDRACNNYKQILGIQFIS